MFSGYLALSNLENADIDLHKYGHGCSPLFVGVHRINALMLV